LVTGLGLNDLQARISAEALARTGMLIELMQDRHELSIKSDLIVSDLQISTFVVMLSKLQVFCGGDVVMVEVI
jgi:hypothetical protein